MYAKAADDRAIAGSKGGKARAKKLTKEYFQLSASQKNIIELGSRKLKHGLMAV